MAVKYVSEFSFPSDFGFKTGDRVKGYAKGGHVKPSTPKRFAKGGSPDIATGKVAMGAKKPWNENDAVSPGSPKRTPPSQSSKNSAAASSKFASDGRGTPPATKQTGDVERMSGYSDFKKGGRVKKAAGGGCNRIANLGHYAHGGKVKPEGTKSEKPSGKPVGKSTAKAAGKPMKGTKKASAPAEKKMAGGGLTHGTSKKQRGAIHAKMKHASPSLAGPLAAAAEQMGGQGMPHPAPQPGMGQAPPPGMAPGMGSPPGGMMGGMRPQGPQAGPPAMADGGALHIVHHIQ